MRRLIFILMCWITQTSCEPERSKDWDYELASPAEKLKLDSLREERTQSLPYWPML